LPEHSLQFFAGRPVSALFVLPGVAGPCR